MDKMPVFLRYSGLSGRASSLLRSETFSNTIITFKSTKKGHDSSSSCSSSDTSDNEISQKRLKSNEALKKLNILLQQMVQEDVSKENSMLDLAKPTNKRMSKEERKAVKPKALEERIVDAAKDVSQSIGGNNVKQIESELLTRLLTPPQTEENNEISSLSNIIKGMKIDREQKSEGQSRAAQVKQILSSVRPDLKEKLSQIPTRQRRPVVRSKLNIVPEKIDLFGSKPLGIFTNSNSLEESKPNETWKALHERDLKLAVTTPPANYFQEMILWTEQKKIWRFPIDSEQDIGEEKNVDFADHVFLEQHLEGWFPMRGPIRHFMELVCVGLSKNPYLTVQAKKDHIEWYKNYFEDKKKMLQDVGAIPIESSKSETKQIE